jgi:hypothetical protein
MNSIVQSVLINKHKYTPKQAIKWLKENGFKFYKIDETENFYRFRQVNPVGFKYYRIKKITDDIELVIGYL